MVKSAFSAEYIPKKSANQLKPFGNMAKTNRANPMASHTKAYLSLKYFLFIK